MGTGPGAIAVCQPFVRSCPTLWQRIALDLSPVFATRRYRGLRLPTELVERTSPVGALEKGGIRGLNGPDSER